MTEVTLTKNEREVMDLLWQVKQPLSKSEIIQLSPERSWKEASIHNILNTLMSKEFIGVKGFKKTTKNYARTFAFQISREEYDALQMRIGLSRISEESIPYLMSALVSQTESRAIIEELEKMLEQKKEELTAESEK